MAGLELGAQFNNIGGTISAIIPILLMLVVGFMIVLFIGAVIFILIRAGLKFKNYGEFEVIIEDKQNGYEKDRAGVFKKKGKIAFYTLTSKIAIDPSLIKYKISRTGKKLVKLLRVNKVDYRVIDPNNDLIGKKLKVKMSEDDVWTGIDMFNEGTKLQISDKFQTYAMWGMFAFMVVMFFVTTIYFTNNLSKLGPFMENFGNTLDLTVGRMEKIVTGVVNP